MKRNSVFILLLFLSCLLSAQSNYYVSNSGLNSNSGESINDAWKTIEYGCNELSPGDTLNIIGGTYNEKIELENSGLQDKRITIRAYKNDSVIVDGTGILSKKALFHTHNVSYYTLKGIHFTNNFYTFGDGGFYADGYGTGIELLDCKFSNISISSDASHPVTNNTNQPVVSFVGDDTEKPLTELLIQNIEVYNCRPGYSECISLNGNVSDFVIANNSVHDNANIGIDIIGNYGTCETPELDHARNGIIKNNVCYNNYSPVSTAGGIYVDGGHDIVIENNILYNNDYGAEIGCEENGTTENIIFKNNIIYNNTKAGMALGGYNEDTSGTVINAKIYNNTFYNNDTDASGNGELFLTLFENGSIYNNIFHLSDNNFLMSCTRAQPNLKMDYNLIYCKDGKKDVFVYWLTKDVKGFNKILRILNIGINNTFGNPHFTNSENANFKLSRKSAAINSGNATYDFINTEASNLKTVTDCGAFPYEEQ